MSIINARPLWLWITSSRKRRVAAIERLMTALGDLPEKKRALIEKCFFEGKTVAVIAEEIGLSKSAAQGRLRCAEGALLQCFNSSLKENLRIPWALFAKPEADEIFSEIFLNPQRMSDRP